MSGYQPTGAKSKEKRAGVDVSLPCHPFLFIPCNLSAVHQEGTESCFNYAVMCFRSNALKFINVDGYFNPKPWDRCCGKQKDE